MEESLDREVAHYRGQALAPSTRKTYRSQLKSYLDFCSGLGYRPVPGSPSTLARYLAFLARRLKASSIRVYLAAVRLIHLEAGLPNPFEGSWFLTSVLRGIKRDLGGETTPKRPITLHLLLLLRKRLDPVSPMDNFLGSLPGDVLQ